MIAGLWFTETSHSRRLIKVNGVASNAGEMTEAGDGSGN